MDRRGFQRQNSVGGGVQDNEGRGSEAGSSLALLVESCVETSEDARTFWERLDLCLLKTTSQVMFSHAHCTRLIMCISHCITQVSACECHSMFMPSMMIGSSLILRSDFLGVSLFHLLLFSTSTCTLT